MGLAQRIKKGLKKMVPASVVTYQNPKEAGPKKTYTLRGSVGRRTPRIDKAMKPTTPKKSGKGWGP